MLRRGYGRIEFGSCKGEACDLRLLGLLNMTYKTNEGNSPVANLLLRACIEVVAPIDRHERGVFSQTNARALLLLVPA